MKECWKSTCDGDTALYKYNSWEFSNLKHSAQIASNIKELCINDALNPGNIWLEVCQKCYAYKIRHTTDKEEALRNRKMYEPNNYFEY